MIVLCPVAAIAAALSFESLQTSAARIFGALGVGFPALVDLLILGATLAYLAGATVGRPEPGWRWTAHTGVVSTLALNALTSTTTADLPWHIAPPLVWAALVEMTARQVTSSWRAQHATTACDPIPARMWLSSPRSATRTWLHMARTGEPDHRRARADLALHAAALLALHTAMPHRSHRRARRLIRTQLRNGALDPAAILGFLQHRELITLEPHTAVIVQAVLLEGEAPSTDADTTTARIAAPPQHSLGLSADPPSPTAPSRRPDTTKTSTAEPVPAREHGNRHQAAVEILRTHPNIDGPHLAQALTKLGWHVSARTARRILTQAGHDITSPPDTDDRETTAGIRS